MAREYIQWPGAVLYPGADVWPGYVPSVEDDVTEVRSHLGSVWEKVDDETTRGIADAVKTAYESGQATAATGDFPVSLDRITESAGLASVDTAVVREIWSRVVTAERGTFLQVTADMIAANSITADKIQVGAIDGQVITGATIRTAESGTRIEMTSSYFRAYDNLNNIKVNITPATGTVVVDGKVGRTDSWSEGWFTDVTSADNDRDIGPNGTYHGVGLVMDATDESWAFGGTVSIIRTGPARTGVPTMRLQAPLRSGTFAPYFTMSEDGFIFNASSGAYTHIGASRFQTYLGDEANSRFYLNQNVFWGGSNYYSFSAARGGMWYSTQSGSQEFSLASNGFTIRNSATAYMSSDAGGIRMSTNNSQRWIGINASACVMSWDSDHQAHTTSQYGISHRGGKNFVMQVPGMSEHKGGKDLIHACTESPYDGIEYWGNEVVPDGGSLRVSLPEYVPLIHNREAPHTLQVTSTSGHPRAWLDLDTYEVVVEDDPGATVNWLVKMARMMDRHNPDTGELELYGREFWKDPWIEPLRAEIQGAEIQGAEILSAEPGMDEAYSAE